MKSHPSSGNWLLLAVLVAAPAYATEHCRSFVGTLHSHAVPTPPCTSAIGLCTEGTLDGGLSAGVEIVGDTFGVLQGTWTKYTGVVTLTLDDGSTLTGTDVGYLDTDSSGTLLDITTVTGGSGAWDGARGVVIFEGTFSLTTGLGTSRYLARVCR